MKGEQEKKLLILDQLKNVDFFRIVVSFVDEVPVAKI